MIILEGLKIEETWFQLIYLGPKKKQNINSTLLIGF